MVREKKEAEQRSPFCSQRKKGGATSTERGRKKKGRRRSLCIGVLLGECGRSRTLRDRPPYPSAFFSRTVSSRSLSARGKGEISSLNSAVLPRSILRVKSLSSSRAGREEKEEAPVTGRGKKGIILERERGNRREYLTRPRGGGEMIQPKAMKGPREVRRYRRAEKAYLPEKRGDSKEGKRLYLSMSIERALYPASGRKKKDQYRLWKGVPFSGHGPASRRACTI